jgi:hypothetical protein
MVDLIVERIDVDVHHTRDLRLVSGI